MEARLRRLVEQAIGHVCEAGELSLAEDALPPFNVEIPNDRAHGDFASNAALALARPARRKPRDIADLLREQVRALAPAASVPLRDVEVAGPGFLNFHLEPGWLDDVVNQARSDRWGESRLGAGQRVLVEFVSANATGPLNLVNARAAAYGDAICRVLAAAGYRVWREYYVNDAGNQFERFKETLRIRYLQTFAGRDDLDIPEGAYPGAYMIDLAKAATAELGGPRAVDALPEAERWERLARLAMDRMVEAARETLERYRVRFDRWASEEALRQAGSAQTVFERLVAAGHTFEQDGAVWLRSTAFGDDKDRVLRRGDGSFTYIVPDIAYHADKLARLDADRADGAPQGVALDLLGQDHHGYVARLRAAIAALGEDATRIEVLINQMVMLVRGGDRVRMSKRKGDFVTMDEFLSEVDVDAARYFFAARALDTMMDFDLDLANLRSNENPVYYAQYAHARIVSLLERARENGLWGAEGTAGAEAGVGTGSPAEAAEAVDTAGPGSESAFPHPSEQALLWEVARFPDEVAHAAANRTPHRLTTYVQQLAAAYHVFYTDCRVLGEPDTAARARLHLSDATRNTIARCLQLLGVSAPDHM